MCEEQTKGAGAYYSDKAAEPPVMTMRQSISDEIMGHKLKIAELEHLRDNLTPETEKFINEFGRIIRRHTR